MKRNLKKYVAMVMVAIIIITTAGQSTVKAAVMHSPQTVLTEERADLEILTETKNGDTYHSVYKYSQNNEVFKRIDTASIDFKSTKSEVYQFINNEFKKVETQYTNVNNDGNIDVHVQHENGKNDDWEIVINDENISNDTISTQINNYDWITEESDGSKYVGGLGRAALIGAITAIAGHLSKNVLTAAAVGAATTIADAIFGGGINYIYYHKIYNWKHCEKNYLVIEETEYTRFYEDPYHRFFINSTYTEWRC